MKRLRDDVELLDTIDFWLSESMPRVNAILKDARFSYGMKRITLLEKERIFCCHQLDHLLDVARIAWIITMEQQLPLEKEIVYGVALLHDLGRYRQYEENIAHHQASAELALEILAAAGYTEIEVTQMVDAIRQHGEQPQNQSVLAQVLYQADKLSRNCFCCPAQSQCKWIEEKRNKTITY